MPSITHHHKHHNAYLILQISMALLFFIIPFIFKIPQNISSLFFIGAFIIAGKDTLLEAFKNFLQNKWMNENTLMSLAGIGAIGIGEYPEAAMVMILYQSGEYLQHKAVEESRKSITDLMDLRSDIVYKEEQGIITNNKPEEIKVNDIIIVRSGEKIPLDGIIIEGNAAIDTSGLTGESLPKDFFSGDEVLSGYININGFLKIKVLRIYKESTASKILDLIEHADNHKSHSERFITRFARYYTPIIIIISFLLAVCPPLFFSEAVFLDWFKRALTFIVISCPCALIISIPLSFFAGIGGASRKGILIKGSNYFEALAHCRISVFDKTGTLTEGNFIIDHLYPVKDITPTYLLQTAAKAENTSNHPIARSITKACRKGQDFNIYKQAKEISGLGIILRTDKEEILVGNHELMKRHDIKGIFNNNQNTTIHIARNRKYLGHITVKDKSKEEAFEAISQLHHLNIKTIMLTGDNKEAAQAIANQLNIKDFYTNLLPLEKIKKLEEIKNKNNKGTVIFVGDGINDAPVLTYADVGIAMGGLGTDAAIEAADVVIMDDSLLKIPLSIRIAQKTLRIVWQNIFLALSVKTIFLLLGALGMMTMWGAVFADVGISLLAVLNSLRAFRN